MMLIHRTAYPFTGEIEQYANRKIDELFDERYGISSMISRQGNVLEV